MEDSVLILSYSKYNIEFYLKGNYLHIGGKNHDKKHGKYQEPHSLITFVGEPRIYMRDKETNHEQIFLI